jgi:hypothetical protein
MSCRRCGEGELVDEACYRCGSQRPVRFPFGNQLVAWIVAIAGTVRALWRGEKIDLS